MKKFKILIAEDDENSLSYLKNILESSFSDEIIIEDTATSLLDAQLCLSRKSYDFCIFDIDFKRDNTDCFSVLSKIPKHKTGHIIFYTSTQDKYLNQMIGERIRFIHRIPKPGGIDDIKAALVKIYAEPDLDTIRTIPVIYDNSLGKIKQVTLEKIVFIESIPNKNKSLVHFHEPDYYTETTHKNIGGKNYTAKECSIILKQFFEGNLLSNSFIQCHRSYIININYFGPYRRDSKNGARLVTMHNNIEITVTSDYIDQVSERLGYSIR